MTSTDVEIQDGLTWPLVYVQPCEAMAELEDSQVERMEQVAAEFLWRWTGQQFGTRTITGLYEPYGEIWQERPSTFDGRGPWSNLISPPTTFRHADPRRRYGLKVQNLVAVNRVLIDGQDFTGYEVSGNYIYRTDGQNWLGREEITLEVVSGNPLPISGQYATGLLACEFAKAATDDPDCQLPARVQSITREGISVAVMDQFEDLHEGHTGIWTVDQWVASIMHAPRQSSVMSPDFSPRRTQLRKSW